MARKRRIIIWKEQLQLPVVDDFLKKVVCLPSGCWKSPLTISFFGIVKGNYHWSYLLFVGRIAKNYHIHHTCLNHWCCNPTHLIQVTRKQHSQLHLEESRGRVLKNEYTDIRRKIVHLPSRDILDTRLKQLLVSFLE